MDSSSKSLHHLQKFSAQLYFNWLEGYELLEHFESPETIESVCYSMNFPQELTEIIEQILTFMTYIGVFNQAGGTFALSSDIDQIRTKWANQMEIDPMSPLTHFIETGLKLLDDRIQGGSSTWDEKSHHFIIESVFTMNELIHRELKILNYNKLDHFQNNPDVGIYAIFPQTSIELFAYHVKNLASLSIITPTIEIKNQAISYCELNSSVNQYSNQIYLNQDIEPNSIDVLFIPNGFLYDTSLKNMLKYIYKILSDNGIVYFNETNEPENRVGFEPLLILHPRFNPAISKIELSRMLKANGFSEPLIPSSSNKFMYAMKQG